MIMRIKKYFYGLLVLILSACTVGPNYKKPCVQVPAHLKETKNWQPAHPCDDMNRGQWWKIFHDPQLNRLEDELNQNNQTIANAEANYRNARALVNEARAAYFPTLALSGLLTRQKSAGGLVSASSGAITVNGGAVGSTGRISTSHSWLLTAVWEPDFWGAIHRSVEANTAFAQSSDALWALTRLSAQTSLAQYYFELRGVDVDQYILNDAVVANKNILKLVENQYHSGTAAEADVIQARAQLEVAEASAINIGITRSQYEHAIAVLIGCPPADFSIKSAPLKIITPPKIPLTVPSLLLERRPDVAQAERLVAQANAQIGLAISAFFPTITINGSSSYQHLGTENWFSMPNLGWAIGPQLAETILDGGLRSATVAAARANYAATVASYRQIVLTAFQDTEDNLVALRVLGQQSVVQDKAANDAKLALKLTVNQYKAGTVPYNTVLTTQITAYNAMKNAADTHYLRMTAAVGLIKSLGGGWNDVGLTSTNQYR